MYGKYVPPGGKFEEDETPEECAIREFKEETSLDLGRPLIYRGVVFFDNKNRKFNGKPAKFNFLCYIFETRSYTGTMTHPNEGTLVWVPDNEIKDLPIEKGDKYIVDWIESGQHMHHRIVLGDTDAHYELLPSDFKLPR